MIECLRYIYRQQQRWLKFIFFLQLEIYSISILNEWIMFKQMMQVNEQYRHRQTPLERNSIERWMVCNRHSCSAGCCCYHFTFDMTDRRAWAPPFSCIRFMWFRINDKNETVRGARFDCRKNIYIICRIFSVWILSIYLRESVRQTAKVSHAHHILMVGAAFITPISRHFHSSLMHTGLFLYNWNGLPKSKRNEEKMNNTHRLDNEQCDYDETVFHFDVIEKAFSTAHNLHTIDGALQYKIGWKRSKA